MVSAQVTSKANMAKALALALGIIALAWLSFANAVGSATAKTGVNPITELLGPQPLAEAVEADKLLHVSITHPTNGVAIIDLAKSSLKRDPLGAQAMRVIAVSAGPPSTTRHIPPSIEMATALSRRDLGTHLWMVEFFASHENVRQALASYNLALVTSYESRALLFPALARALDDPSIYSEFRKIMARDPDWLIPFLQYAVAQDFGQKQLALLLMDRNVWKHQNANGEIERVLISKLISNGDIDSTVKLFSSLKDVDLSLLYSPRFSEASADENRSALAWQTPQNGALGAAFDNAQSKNLVLSTYAGTGLKGIVASKPLFLKPGRYQLQATFGQAPLSSGAAFGGRLVCVGTASPRVLWSMSQTNDFSGLKLADPIQIGTDCRGQRLDFELSGGQSQQGSNVQISSINIVPASQ
jgi:hypothetical protein